MKAFHTGEGIAIKGKVLASKEKYVQTYHFKCFNNSNLNFKKMSVSNALYQHCECAYLLVS